ILFLQTANLLFQLADTLLVVTNGAIVIHTQRLKSDPGGNLLS
ncbi:peptide synthetase, partial [Escherichia coli]|nr:peptide synthetase [Escherichia coli]